MCALIVYGSPPRAWGQCTASADGECHRRFTPTGVGTINGLHFPLASPHGSPPRAWGQFESAPGGYADARFTPTGVGTMRIASEYPSARFGSPPRAWGQFSGCRLRYQPAAVHPHGRGDNAVRCGQQDVGIRFTPTGVGTITAENVPTRRYLGSPPRAWGQCRRMRIAYACVWFTPTGVGTMRPPAARARAPPVHPHGRGDNIRTVAASDCNRAWGQY